MASRRAFRRAMSDWLFSEGVKRSSPGVASVSKVFVWGLPGAPSGPAGGVWRFSMACWNWVLARIREVSRDMDGFPPSANRCAVSEQSAIGIADTYHPALQLSGQLQRVFIMLLRFLSLGVRDLSWI